MSAEVMFNGFLSVNSVNLSARCRELHLNDSFPPIDASAMGDRSHILLPGLEEWTVTAVFIMDYAVGSVFRTLNALKGSAGFPIVFRKDSGVAAATNPQYSGNAILGAGFNMFDASFGNLSTVSVTFNSAGVLTRAEV